jgi:secondary thiamine-phosphate synthase enzyme
MSWAQTTFSLPSRARGSYLITDEVVKAVPQIKEYKIGILHLFVQHTSCGIAMNENWDDDVRADMSDALDRIVPMDKSGKMYRHNAEGDDDMPVSASAFGVKKKIGYMAAWLHLVLNCQLIIVAYFRLMSSPLSSVLA